MAKKKIDYAAMFTLRKDGRYQGSYTDATGRHYVYDRDPEKLFQRIRQITDKETMPEIPTFRQIAEDWERQHREEVGIGTWKNYAPHYAEILRRHGDKHMEDVTALDVTNHLTAAKTQGYSRTVANSIRSLYRMIFDYAVANNHAKYNPVASVKLPKGLKQGKRTAPTDEQIKIICQNIDAPFGLFPFFLLCTGLRKSEALALTWRDLDFNNNEISVTKSLDYTVGAKPQVKPPKTEAGNRVVPIIDVLLPYLQEASRKATSDYLFPAPPSNRGGKGGGLMTLRGYEGMWERYCEAVGLQGIGAHNLRHGTATLMFELDVDVHTTQRILGHSRVEVTQEIYTDLRAAQKRKSVSKFNEGMTKYMEE
jgi:integrase